MKENNEHIDNLFREELHDHNILPPSDSWNNIVTELDRKNNKRRLLPILGIAAGIVLLASTTAIVFKYLQNEPYSKTAVETRVSNDTELKSESPLESSDSEKKEEDHNKKNIPFVEKKNAVSNNKKKSTIDKPNDKAFQPVKLKEKTSYIATGKEEAPHALPANNLHTGQRKNTSALSSMNSKNVLLAQANNLPEVPDNYFSIFSARKKNHNLSLGGRFLTEGIASARNSKSSLLSRGGGMQIAYNQGNRFQIESGIYLMSVNNAITSTYDTERMDLAKKQPESYKAVMQSVSDNLNPDMDKRNTGSLESSFSEEWATADNSPIYSSQELETDYLLNYLNIPLIASYKVIDREADLHISGGIWTHFLIEESANNHTEYGFRQTKTPEFHENSFSGSFGLELEYPVIENISVSLEQQTKYHLNPYAGIKSNPYSFGIHAGLTYRFK